MKPKICIALLLFSSAIAAQVLRVEVGNITYSYPASLTGVMPFANGETLQIGDHVFLLSETNGMQVNGSVQTAVSVDESASGQTTVYIQPNLMADSVNTYDCPTNSAFFNSALSGLILHFDSSGVTHVEIESVDGYAIAGSDTMAITMHDTYTPYLTPDKYSIITYRSADTFTAGKDYFVPLFPTDLYGGYRLSIFKNGLVAHYFGVHQRAEAGSWIRPLDLHEDQLEFDDPSAPLVEEERPGLNEETRLALAAYNRYPNDSTRQALLEVMGVRYDKVVARKKAKLRELEREAKHQALVDEMQAIVDEMVENRDIRLEQQFLRLIDPRVDEDASDAWMVLRGANDAGTNPYIAYAPVTNAEYALFDSAFTYPIGEAYFPVVSVTYAQASAYCAWMSAQDSLHSYRLPTEDEWILAAGHMPKDVVMNTNHIEAGLTAVDAYSQAIGACGGVDFWGNCWEWTSTTDAAGLYVVKGGAWDSSRDQCRTEYSDDVRNGAQGYANVGFRIVRED